MDENPYKAPQRPRWVVVGWVLFALSFGAAILCGESGWISNRVCVVWIAASGLIGVPESFWRHKWLGWTHIAVCIVIFVMAFFV